MDASGSQGDVQAMVLNTAGLPAAKVQREPAKEIREQQAQGLSWAGGSGHHCPTLYGGALSQNQKPGLGWSSVVECFHVLTRAEAGYARFLQHAHKSRS